MALPIPLFAPVTSATFVSVVVMTTNLGRLVVTSTVAP
jgi:hypothetical protein